MRHYSSHENPGSLRRSWAEIQRMAPGDRKQGEIFRDVEPEDQLKYGLIPEFAVSLPEQRFF